MSLPQQVSRLVAKRPCGNVPQFGLKPVDGCETQPSTGFKSKKISLKQLLISKLKPQPVGCEEGDFAKEQERLASFSSALRAVWASAAPADTQNN
ncbi:hypothetical protein [Ectopseudomonas oleovorans]|uniref:hypothetical protein n=1 Tax=Ectopseudomonas oleovorans TaxID=301 RepID=UPI0010BF1076|nr:hypothetical protein [Pseudomonas oleovorans]